MAPHVTPAPRFFYGWVIVATCFLITLVASGTMMAFGVFITPMVEDLGWSYSTLSFAYAISSIVSGLGLLAVGSLIHAHSVRRLLLLGSLLHGVGLYLTSTVTTVGAFYFWYGFVASLGRSVFMLTSVTLITRWFEKRRGMVMGLTMAGSGLGLVIFSPLLTWVILRWDWQMAFAALSVLITAVVVLGYFFLRDFPHEMGLVPYGAAPSPVPPPQAVPQAATSRSASSVGALWRSVLRKQDFWTLAGINFFCCVCHSIPLVHVVAFAQNAGLSAFASAWVLALLSLSSIAGRLVWGLFADRHGVRLALMLTLFIQGALVLWLVDTQDPVIFFLYALVWGFGFGGVNTQYGVVAREVFGPRLFGPGFSGQMCFSMLGMAVGAVLGGSLYDLSHSYTVAWLISFGAGLISALLAMDLLAQGEQAKAAPAAAEPGAVRPAQTTGV